MALNKGKLFLILGPSGSGKGVVIAHLRQAFPEAIFPVSCTTRQPRPTERDGDVYHFIGKESFQKKINAGEFLEYAIVHHDNMYGTLKQPILNALEEGKIVIREVDMQGVESIRSLLPSNQVIAIFLTVPSWEVLKNRILKRHQETKEELARRKVSFEKEIAFSKTCDFVVASEEGKQDAVCREVERIISEAMTPSCPGTLLNP